MTRNYLAKIVIACFILTAAISCTSILDKKYDPSSLEEDYKELSKELTPEDIQLIKDYIRDSDKENYSNSTYNDILFYAECKKDEEKRIAIRKAEMEKQKAEMEKQVQPKKELLCSKKWKLKSMRYVMRTDDDSIIVLKMTDQAASLFGKKIKKTYAIDGTFQEATAREVIQEGTWSFTDLDEIKEVRKNKSNTSRLKQSEVYLLYIHELNEKEFTFLEEKTRSYYGGSGEVTKLITLEAQ